MDAVQKSGRGGNLEAQRERAIATRATIVAVARALFAEVGFHAAGTIEIAAQAQVTRGALYHHFADKEDLFAAVFRLVVAELNERSRSAVASLSGDLWSQVTEAFQQYLMLVAESDEYRRILLIDGPAVLGWVRWRELQSAFVAQGTADALQMLMDQGLVERQPITPLAGMIQAALHDAALSIANAAQPVTAAEQAMCAFSFMMRGMRQTPAAT
ncbi:helix-turn-helix domain-containing protein [Novosphingobium sp. MMS21-SN21R]|uniref:TetR/AcrR family transcriptional regulator n=1 Tax=Novosphingobium sp. MMS21-SN21R TaxID=2969298 RepID=UPI002888B519|nr:helix-turn-helix domain-containing protein [Novosphingobium sp. MMS21-SN21R]MDT0509927.1 helix-turn-helix domain-containing protein [Novosphingobium sp. MMS21-SN21R]